VTVVPFSGPAFEALMRDVDAKLRDAGEDISNRPLHAVREISIRYGVSIPLGGTLSRLDPELALQIPVGEAIHKWYKDNYGDRLNVDPCPGRTVLLLEGDLYILRVPRFFGQPILVVQREFLTGPSIGRAPVRSNIVQFVDGVTPARAARLSDGALKEIAAAFERALPASYILEGIEHELAYLARGDVATAVAKLMEKSDRFGESKWASLQAAEKCLKAAIALEGHSYGFTHDLRALNGKLRSVGIDIGDEVLLDHIQCSPRIRYGEEPCDRDEALLAHHASLELVNRLDAAGARFSRSPAEAKSTT
jgi:HEPN domain-containing protein